MNTKGITSSAVMTLISVIVALQTPANAELKWDQGINQLSAEIARLKVTHPDDIGLKELETRVSVIRDLSQQLIDRFESTRNEALDSLLADAVGVPQAHDVKPAEPSLSAAELYSEHESIFAASLTPPAIDEGQLSALRQHYNQVIEDVLKYISERGMAMAAVQKENAAEIVELCAVLPFLHAGDDAWTPNHVQQLPSWMQQADNLKILERFALRLRRPQTAFQISNRQTASVKPSQLDYSNYLHQAAQELVAMADYRAAIYCLEIGIGRAQANKDGAAVASLQFELAQIYATAGHPQLAADKMKELLTVPIISKDDYGKSAMLRLKYLYESEQFADVLRESQEYQSKEQCKLYRPQILYIAWVANRRQNQPEAAEAIQKTFLEEFPEHPLGADLYFASAMTALASSDYEEAKRVLEIVEYRYPNSKLKEKVKEIRQKLDKLDSVNSAAAVSPTN